MIKLKFRAWIKDIQCMVNVVSVNFETATITCYIPNSTETSTACAYSFKDIELMPLFDSFTAGEVFEGDMLKCTNSEGETYITELGKGGVIEIDSYSDYESTRLDWAIDNDDICDFEIVGNIYENPKILRST